MFLGRQRELGRLRKELSRKGKSAVLIYGRRRIGKTTLISEALKDNHEAIIRFTAVPDELSENARRLSRIAGEVLGIPGLQISDFEALLKFIAAQKHRMVLEIDEYQDLRKKAKGEVVDAYMRDFIDYAPDSLKIIISGSAIRVMKELLNKDNPLYGRFTLEMPLGELDYLESSLFYPERSIREKITLYAAFGGVPMILSMIDPESSVEDNIKALLVDRTGFARTYTEGILYAEFKGAGGAYSAITRIGNGKRTYSEILSTLEDDESRNSLDYTLEQLQKADFIDKKQPINLKNSRRKRFYELRSNMLRFHLAFIEKNPEALATAAFFEKSIKPSLDTFVSYRFEDIARQWFLIQAEKGIRDDIISVGTYWYDDKELKKNGEFDVALETIEGYEIYEAKFLSSPMPDSLIAEEVAKTRRIPGLGIEAIGFISSSGFEHPAEGRIAGSDLYAI